MKKAFTLIETLAVIIILGIVGLIVYPSISNLVGNSKNKAYDKQISIIIDAAKVWSNNNTELYNEENNVTVQLENLIKQGYITNTDDGILHNPKTGEAMNGCVYIRYSNTYNQYLYNYFEGCEIPETPLTPVFTNNGVFNEDGWANNNFYVTIAEANYTSFAYCIDNKECDPSVTIESNGGNVLVSNNSATNYVCAKGINNGIEGDIACSDAFKLDTIKPTLGNVEITGVLGNNNWYTSDVSLSVSDGADNLSGHKSTNVSTNSVTLNGINVVTITITDNADNINTIEYNINVDKELPNLTGLSEINITYGQTYDLTLTGTDQYSGIFSTTSNIINTALLTAGTHTITYTVIDLAGNTKDFTRTINVN